MSNYGSEPIIDKLNDIKNIVSNGIDTVIEQYESRIDDLETQLADKTQECTDLESRVGDLEDSME